MRRTSRRNSNLISLRSPFPILATDGMKCARHLRYAQRWRPHPLTSTPSISVYRSHRRDELPLTRPDNKRERIVTIYGFQQMHLTPICRSAVFSLRRFYIDLTMLRSERSFFPVWHPSPRLNFTGSDKDVVLQKKQYYQVHYGCPYTSTYSYLI